MKPTFIVIGSMKGGTTALHRALSEHPQVAMAERETGFFAGGAAWREGWSSYEAQFDHARGATAVGERATAYTKFPDVAGVPVRMAAHLPDVRLLYAVRHPVVRIRSQYLHEWVRGEESLPFPRAVRARRRYVDTSRYAMQVGRFLECFPRSQLHVFTSEELADDRSRTLGEIWRFLGVEPWNDPSSERTHHVTAEKVGPRPLLGAVQGTTAYRRLSASVPTSWKPLVRPLTQRRVTPDRAILDDDTRTFLEDAVRDDVVQLKALLGPGFDGWGLA